GLRQLLRPRWAFADGGASVRPDRAQARRAAPALGAVRARDDRWAGRVRRGGAPERQRRVVLACAATRRPGRAASVPRQLAGRRAAGVPGARRAARLL